MATKKPETNEPHDDFKTMPSTMPTEQPAPQPVVPVVPMPEPAPQPVVLTQYHGLNEDESRRVAKVKSDIGTLVGYLKTLRDSVHDAESQRMYSVAITHAETASMWAVRAITNRG